MPCDAGLFHSVGWMYLPLFRASFATSGTTRWALAYLSLRMPVTCQHTRTSTYTLLYSLIIFVVTVRYHLLNKIMKTLLLTILLFFVGVFNAGAQLTTSQRLYYLCKAWGYLKYHHPAHCSINWNDLLLGKVDSVVAATSDAGFNATLYNMCLAVGKTTRPAAPLVISGDTAKNYNTAWFNSTAFTPAVRDFLDSVQAHGRPDISKCMLAFNNNSDPNYSSYIDFRRDSINNIPGFAYSNLRHRLLVYFYYWNTIKYFAPQIDIADHPWDSTLIQFMPDMVAANIDSSFELTLSRIVSRIDDSHGFFYGSRYWNKAFYSMDYVGQAVYRAKVRMARIEGKNVITASDESGINVGDVVTKINGLPADTFFARWKPYFAASNEAAKYRDMYTMLIYGPSSGRKDLELTDVTNTTRQVAMYHTSNSMLYSTWLASQVDTLPEYGITQCGYGYVHMGKLTSAHVPAMYAALSSAPAIIFDIRNYPNGTLWDLKPLLFPRPNISARYFSPDLSYPGYYNTKDDSLNFGVWTNNTPYAGKVIILVNEQTQSQAEYTAQVLRTFPRSVIIGSQTAGADGNVSYLNLPGSIRTYWSSLGLYEHDWYNPQRAGIRIDSTVNVTLAGIRSGIDEILSKAFDCKLSVPAVSGADRFILRQQPGLLYMGSTGSMPFSAQIINSLGQRVYSSNDMQQTASVNTTSFAPGIYVVMMADKSGAAKRERIVVR